MMFFNLWIDEDDDSINTQEAKVFSTLKEATCDYLENNRHGFEYLHTLKVCIDHHSIEIINLTDEMEDEKSNERCHKDYLSFEESRYEFS